jgi:hypothetical protein|tara:strand:+ start:294 stop:506 length:213 start_codon:yes stop_codon:yes gene_type:complete
MIKFSTYINHLVKKGLESDKKVIFAKSKGKVKISVSIDSEIHSRLKEHCDENMMKLSTYLEYLIKKGDAQ